MRRKSAKVTAKADDGSPDWKYCRWISDPGARLEAAKSIPHSFLDLPVDHHKLLIAHANVTLDFASTGKAVVL